MASVIVLGAKGRFGRAAVEAFTRAGWAVTRAGRGLSGENCVDVDATDAQALLNVCTGHEVIAHAVNPPYDRWQHTVPKLTNAIITAARGTDATVMIPGNVYNYGRLLPPVLSEGTPWVANTRKGGIRIRMEQAYRNSGVQTIVLRGGDFIDIMQSGNWFESHIAPKASQGKLTYPGPRDLEHAWAFLPDMARAMVGLAEKRDQFSTFEEFGFEGYALTGNELIAHVENVVGKQMRVSRLPWAAIWLMGLWNPLMREVSEMRYLWHRPHAIDGAKLRAALPAFQPTPVEEALSAFLKGNTQAYVSAPTPA